MGGLSISKGLGYCLPAASGIGPRSGGGGFDEVDEYDVVMDGETTFSTSRSVNPAKAQHQVVLNGRIMRRDVDYLVNLNEIQFRYALQAGSCVVVYYVVLA
jgi:hypothetical protein